MGFGKLHQDYTTRVLRVDKTEEVNCQVIKVDVPKNNTHVYLQLYQKNPRIILNNGTYQHTVLSFLILVDSRNNYLLTDINYRYCNEDGSYHGYNVISYAPVAVTLSNKTNQVNVNSMIHKTMVDFCKKELTPSKKSNGLNIYIYKDYTRQLPLMATGYENTSNNYFKTITEVTGKGNKSFYIYCDDYASEDDTTVIKPLPPKSMTCVIVLKYSNSTIVSYSSSIAVSSANTNTRTNTNTNKGTNNVTPASSVDNNPVFKTEGEEIDEDGYLIQYLLKGSNNSYVIGLENTSNFITLSLSVEGLDILDSIYKGQAKPVFTIKSREKKVFNVKVKSNYYGNVTFQFEYE